MQPVEIDPTVSELQLLTPRDFTRCAVEQDKETKASICIYILLFN